MNYDHIMNNKKDRQKFAILKVFTGALITGGILTFFTRGLHKHWPQTSVDMEMEIHIMNSYF